MTVYHLQVCIMGVWPVEYQKLVTVPPEFFDSLDFRSMIGLLLKLRQETLLWLRAIFLLFVLWVVKIQGRRVTDIFIRYISKTNWKEDPLSGEEVHFKDCYFWEIKS